MHAVARKLGGGHIVPEQPARGALFEQGLEHPKESLVGSGRVLTASEQRDELLSVMLEREQRVGLQHELEPLAGIARAPACRLERCEMTRDLLLVPRNEDGLDVVEIFVDGGAPYTRPLGNLRHRHLRRATLGRKRGSRLEDRVPYLRAVGFDRVGPKARHHPILPGAVLVDAVSLMNTLVLQTAMALDLRCHLRKRQSKP